MKFFILGALTLTLASPGFAGDELTKYPDGFVSAKTPTKKKPKKSGDSGKRANQLYQLATASASVLGATTLGVRILSGAARALVVR
jgi:hypothetical protein